ncbi:MAG TPA: MFS transporter [Tepidiformaceae bacterium]|nr:MFS transporter [Tepidiformaceae bacterium]
MRSRFSRGLWAHPDFVRLWAGTTTSTFGSLIGYIALSFTAIEFLNATAAQVAILGACQLVPGFLVSPVAGVWVDRLSRRPILIVSDIGRAAALFTVPLAAGAGVLGMWQLYAVSVVTSMLSVFFQAAYQSYLPTLVTRDELLEGNARLSATASVAEVGSFGISGWLVQLLKAPGAVAVDATSFVVSAYFIWRIRQPEPPVERDTDTEHFWREARDGAGLVVRNPVLRAMALAECLSATSERTITTVFLLYLNQELGFEAGVLGLIFAVGGVTSLGGAYLANRGTLFFGGVGRTLAVSSFMRATGMLFMPLCAGNNALGIAFLVANQVVTDPFWALWEIHDVSLKQASVPERMQGRLFANFRLISFGFALVGTALGGVLGATIGFRATLFVGVGLMYGAAAVLAFSPLAKVRQASDASIEMAGAS